MDIKKIPDLSFPMVLYGRTATIWTLLPLLYKGGAKAHARKVAIEINEGTLGPPLMHRLSLVVALHQELTGHLMRGNSQRTVYSKINILRIFFGWADRTNQHLTKANVENIFRLWADSLMDEARTGKLLSQTAYGKAASVSGVLDRINEREIPLIKTTRLRYKHQSVRATGSVKSDKLDVGKMFSFGRLLLDIIRGLAGDAIWAPLPVRLPLTSGEVILLWSGQLPAEKCISLQPSYQDHSNTLRVTASRKAYSEDKTLRTRSPLANLRMEAELLVFISQTGMNLTQAHQLTLRHFRYESSIDGYKVRDYKNRRRGEVLFEIFAEYKAVFENYLLWRQQNFPDTDELFPFVRHGRTKLTPRSLNSVRDLCTDLEINFFPPQALRKTRINWLLRKSRDPDLAAEEAQHTKQTLLEHYHLPSMQVAMREIVQFWPTIDPSSPRFDGPSVAPGSCKGNASSFTDALTGTPAPDCVNPAGCLFCSSHRDIDSEDHVWSLASMHFLSKRLLISYRPKSTVSLDLAMSAQYTVEALSGKLKWFSTSNETRARWVSESLCKVDEGHFHPHWDYVIASVAKV